jgi:hypothetical protein
VSQQNLEVDSRTLKPKWYVLGLTWLLLVAVSGSLLYSQICSYRWWFSKDIWRYSRGWPLPYGWAENSDFYPMRFIIDIIVSLAIVACTILLMSSFRKRGNWFDTRSIFRILIWAASMCLLTWIDHETVWPHFEPWFVRIGIALGVSCTVWLIACAGVRWVAFFVRLVHGSRKG